MKVIQGAACRNWLWPSEAADELQVSHATVYRWIEQGILPTILTRRPYKIPRWAVVQLQVRPVK